MNPILIIEPNPFLVGQDVELSSIRLNESALALQGRRRLAVFELVRCQLNTDQCAGNCKLTSFLQSLGYGPRRKPVLSVEDWAEIRRLRRSEQLSVSEIARVLGFRGTR